MSRLHYLGRDLCGYENRTRTLKRWRTVSCAPTRSVARVHVPSCTATVLVMVAGARLALVCVLIHLAAIRDTASSPAPAPQPTSNITSFVTRNGTQLEAGGKPYFSQASTTTTSQRMQQPHQNGPLRSMQSSGVDLSNDESLFPYYIPAIRLETLCSTLLTGSGWSGMVMSKGCCLP